MIDIVDKSLVKLKTHPDNGEMYFNIITNSYIHKEKIPDHQIQKKLHLTSSTYFRYKKNAIALMGIILWGYILPSLREAWLLGPDDARVAEVQSDPGVLAEVRVS